jgi:hypothetical protein
MKAKKIVVGMEFYNSFREMKATVMKIDGDQVTVKYEDDTFSNFLGGVKGLKEFLQRSIDNKLQGCEMNVHIPTSLIDNLILSDDVQVILDSMQVNIDFYVDNEWVDSKNEWIKNSANQTKGKVGLTLHCRKMESKGLVVEKNEKGEYDTGSERVAKIGDEKHIVRTAFKTSTDTSITINHIRKDVEWDKLICMIIMPESVEVYEADKDLVYLHLEENEHEIGWITKDDLNVVHWHMQYPVPMDVFTKV